MDYQPSLKPLTKFYLIYNSLEKSLNIIQIVSVDDCSSCIIIVGNGKGNTSSNPRKGSLLFTSW